MAGITRGNSVLGPNVEVRPACRLFVYRVAHAISMGIHMRYVWDRNAEKGHVVTVDE